MNQTIETSGAIISDCKKFRYQLWRIWDTSKPLVMFIMLNPSTANADVDDPTIRKCIAYAKQWGFGGIYVGNLFAYRTAFPKELKLANYPMGEDNEAHLINMMLRCDKFICAWGHKQGIPKLITNIFPKLHYLELAINGTPKHPLYLKKDLKPKVL